VKRKRRWIWYALGTTGVMLLVTRRRRRALRSPIESGQTPRITPHGYFGAPRKGPPVHLHQGVDIAAPAGSRVLAVGDGVIVATTPGLGKVVRKLRLDEPATWGHGEAVAAVVYADLGRPLVNPGDRVKRGDSIALVGAAGFLHFAVKTESARGETFIDPKRAGFAYVASGQERSPWHL